MEREKRGRSPTVNRGSGGTHGVMRSERSTLPQYSMAEADAGEASGEQGEVERQARSRKRQ